MLLTWALLLLVLMGQSLTWRMVHDLPILHSVGWLISEGFIPYREIFEMNLPGTWSIHVVGQQLFGPDAIGIRLTDLSWLLLTLAGAWVCMRGVRAMAGVVDGMHSEVGAEVPAGAALLLGTVYLMGGPMDSLQRDWLMVGPLLFALAGARWHTPSRMRLLQWSGGGFALGWAMLIKPQALLLTPILLGSLALEWQLQRQKPSLEQASEVKSVHDSKAAHMAHLAHSDATVGALLRSLLSWMLGQILPLLGASLLLLSWDAWTDFIALWTQYLGPLYAHLDGDGMELEGGAQLYLQSAHVMVETLWHPARLALLLGGVLGGGLLFQQVKGDRRALLRLAVLLSFVGYGLVHVVVGVKHWWYHWWPAYAALLMLCSGLFLPGPMRRLRWILLGLYATLVLGIALLERPQELKMKSLLEPVDRLTSTLGPLRMPEDRVQVLDTVGGGQHAAFLLGLKPATPFLYDFHFFHHVSEPYIQALRRRLLTRLEQQPPRWVIVWRSSWSHRTDEAALSQFPALTEWLSTHYTVRAEDPAWRLFERRPLRQP